jgi:hypothetical protein
VRQLGVEQRCALELGEPRLTHLAIEQPVAGFAEMIDDEEVVRVPLAVKLTVGILATELSEVVRGHGASWTDP